MAPAGAFKPTLQLRHQLSCGGIAIDAAAYDARRHHLLTYDSHALKPHALRLFSLRREIRWAPLFDADNPPPPVPPPPPSPPGTKKGAKPAAVPPETAPTGDPAASTVLRCVSLFFAYELDVFVCVYSAFRDVPSAAPQPDAVPTGYSVVFLEPASLRKLVVYSGPHAHVLRCACFDEATGRLVLASRVAASWPNSTRDSASRASTVRMVPPSAGEDRSNVVEFLAISKRPFRRPTSAMSLTASTSAGDAAPDRVMLCVEKVTRATLWHSDAIECIGAPPRLHALFGSGVCLYDDDNGDGVGAQGNSIVLEWRESSEGALALARRIVHERDNITSLSASPSGQWLFTGHASGRLKVWNLARKPNPEDDNPQTFAPAGDSTSSHGSAVAVIEVKPVSSAMGSGVDLETAMLYTTERVSGHTRHWRFSAPVAASTTAPPQLDFLGELDVDPASEIRKGVKKRRKRGTMGDWTRTIPHCIAVQMGNYKESLLVVTRGDMIHVVKIQALLQVVHDVPQGEEIFLLRSLPHHGGSLSIVCFSGSSSYHRLHISSMDPRSTKISAPTHCSLPPPTQLQSSVSASLTRLQVCAVNSDDAWILCGWSSGVVEVYDEDCGTTQRVALLQDPRIDVDITALAIMNDRAGVSRKDKKSSLTIENKQSWGGLLKSPSSLGSTAARTCAEDSSARYIVLAGTATGAIFGWRVTKSSCSNVRLVLEASVAICHPPAHSAHVVDLIALSSSSHAFLSMGADGILKLWDIQSTKLIQHINAAASSGAGGTRLGMLCSCVQVLDGGSVIIVGYEDGAIAAWRDDSKPTQDRASVLVQLEAAGSHDRRVSSIVDVGELKFVTASLDMTIVFWVVVPDTNRVEELRFFELGGPVIDCCVIGSIVLVALRDEVCWFTLEEGVDAGEADHSVLGQEVVSQAEINTMERADSVDELSTDPQQDPLRPEDSSPRSPTHTSSPTSQHEDSVISIPSVIVPGSMASIESSAPFSRSGDSSPLDGWMTDQVNESPVDGEVISVYVRQYVAKCGSSGTIAAESLSHFLTMHHLPFSKRMRPDFMIRKHLHERKIDPKTRLTASEAMALLLDIQRTAHPGGANESVGVKSEMPPKMARTESLKRLAEPRKKATRALSEKSSEARIPVVTYNILGEKFVKWVSPAASNQESANSGRNDEGGSRENVSGASAHLTRRRRRRKDPPIKSAITAPVVGLKDRELLQRMHLSPSFQPMWTSGFCWCADSQLIIQWDKGDSTEAAKKPRSVKCGTCGQWCHRVQLQSKDYKPHFTARTILGIVAEVYEMMMEPAHRLLYKNDDKSAQSESEVSIHVTLWKLFQHKFGVQHVVESKLKLLFVSMCHLVREMDAVAVFGELLALFQRPDLDEQVPHKMVALCVVTHSWLYAREMVVNGDPILGSSDSSVESSKATHWQFASLTNALFCAQEVLVYPLVSPGYLQNCLMYMEDYAQRSPTKPHHDDTKSHDEQENGIRWIEVHRLLRLLVGEWKQQTTDLRTTERLLFIEPLAGAHELPGQDQPLATVLEKLRLILSCFVFYDHERVGLTEMTDFEDILRRLKYLWPNEHLSEQEAAGSKRYQDSLTFENTILASRKRFADAQGDGRICYLDFWAMLYIVGVRTKSLLKFREIPSFCKDYKLEVSPGLQDLLRVYMERSSALLLPRGFQTSKSSVDESTRHQHQRRVGGLYDGVHIVDKPSMAHTLSLQELLSHDPQKSNSGLFIDGSIPSMRQSASMTALDAYNSATRGSSSDSVAGMRSREPVVVGVRPLGPTPKPAAFISVSSLEPVEREDGEENLLGRSHGATGTDAALAGRYPASALNESPSDEQLDSFANVYIQFPDVTPRKTLIAVAAASTKDTRSHAGSASPDHDQEAQAWRRQFMEEHKNEEYERQIVHEEHKRRMTLQKEHAAVALAAATAALTASHRHYGHSSPPKERLSPIKPEAVDSRGKSPTPAVTTRRVDTTTSSATPSARVEEPVVVIPTIEKQVGKAPLHGVSTIETLARHAVPRTAGSETSAIMVDLKESMPSTKWASSPREDDSVHHVLPPNEVPDSVAVTVSEPPLEEPSTQPTLSVPIVEPEEPRVILAEVVENEECDDQKEEESGDDEADDDGGEVESGGEGPSEGDGSDQDDVESASNEEGVGPVAATVNNSPPKEEPAKVVTTSEELLPQTVNQDLTPPLPHVDRIVADPAHVEVIRAIDVPRTENEELSQAYKVVAVVPSSDEVAPSVPKEVVIERASSVRNDSVPIKEPQLPASDVRVPIPSPVKSPTATVQPSPTKPGSKPGTSELRHRFKFSQQPKFKLSAAISSNPFRSKAWKPRDDSDSDDGEHGRDSDDDEQAYDDSIAVEDMHLRLSRGSLMELRKEFGRKPSTTRTAGIAAMAFAQGGATRRRLGGTLESGMEGIYEDGPRRNPVRLDEDAERALYGGRALSYLGEGIVFSAEAEVLMQHKWSDFFGTAEATMFSPLKDTLKQREDAQRQEEALQSRLMKKRMEQQHQDTMRLQRNATQVSVGRPPKEKVSDDEEGVANFRARRMTREACLQVQQQLTLGDTVSCTLNEAHSTQYFHFEYLPDASAGWSIVTFKLHVLQGEADMFLSTQTMAPCSSDFMWRSASAESNAISTGSSKLEGQKIVLLPHDIAHIISRGGGAGVLFCLAVVALSPSSTFTLGVMTSGQKAEPSRAIQTVDNLIAHFNQLAKTYEGQASRRMIMTAESGLSQSRSSSSGSSVSGTSSVDRLRAFLASAANMELVEEEGAADGSAALAVSRHSSSRQLCRRSHEERADEGELDDTIEDTVDDADEQEDDDNRSADDSSFQQLLESFGERRGGLRKSRSFLLGGPTSEQREFLQDEEASYQETKARLSPARTRPAPGPGTADTDVSLNKSLEGTDDGESAAIAVVTERRLSTATSMALHQRLGANVKRRLSPLKAASKQDRQVQGGSASLRVARFEPKLAAYSLSSLPPPKHPHKQLGTVAPLVQAKSKR